jgi:DNA-binding CsgD family transcriptional regulator
MKLRSTELRLLGGSRSAAHAQSATAFHGACQRAADLVATERNKSMSPASKLVALIPRTEAPGSKDREVTPFPASLLSRWDARSAGDHSAQLSRRGGDGLTARERNVLALISRGCSNKHIARALEISPETVKSHVKRIFLKLAVGTRAEAAFRAVSLGLL